MKELFPLLPLFLILLSVSLLSFKQEAERREVTAEVVVHIHTLAVPGKDVLVQPKTADLLVKAQLLRTF
jgi:hypothetical protein